MVANLKARNVLLVLLGVAALVMKSRYSGPFPQIVHNYGGNLAASFAVYFMIGIVVLNRKYGRLLSASVAFLAVGLFEATDGFWLMTNVYDPVDFVGDALGVGVAFVVDTVTYYSLWPTSGRDPT